MSAAQVRRDLMVTGYQGTPAAGYDVHQLLESLGTVLDDASGTAVGLVGVGHLGRAVISFLTNRRPRLSLVACFDDDPRKSGRVIQGVRCHPTASLGQVVSETHISVGVIAVPAAAAQRAADHLVAAGVRGLLNFAPANLRLSPCVVVESIDLTVALEKVAYLARASAPSGILP